MIQLEHKQDCCGCAACVQRCPKQCITMKEDEEGFLYPHIHPDICIDCGLCEKVCPVINQNEPREPSEVYAAKNPNDEIRMKSSSGGIFTMLAEQIIDEGGVVFGVGYNEHWEAVHSYTETKDGLAAFRMSKYVQSIVGNTFNEAECFLKKGRKVLYSGTPCQIAGLKKYLRREYENLYTIDFICHGTPSPGVFRWYLGEEMARVARKSDKKYSFALRPIPSIPKADVLAKEYGFNIKDIRFRDKTKGWKKYSFALDLAKTSTKGEKKSILLSYTLEKNIFLRGFLKDLFLRPSCHKCPTKELKSSSDITLGDFWGIEKIYKDLSDDKGISVVVCNSIKGQSLFNTLKIESYSSSYSILQSFNCSIVQSTPITPKRKEFYESELPLLTRISKLSNPGLKRICMNKIVHFIKFVVGEDFYTKIRNRI